MHRSRVGVAFVLAIALGVMPLATDWCTASCAAHLAGMPTADPVCQRESSSTARLGQIPPPCGHDHGILPNLVADRSTAPALVQPVAPVAVVAALPVRTYEAPGRYAEHGLSPPPESIPLTLSFSLRV